MSTFWSRPQVGRRIFFRHLASALSGYYLMPVRPMETVAKAAVSMKNTAKSCIFIFMEGGPSHVDTFDLKEGSWTPPAFQPTSYGNLRFPRGLMPVLAEQLASIAFLRSVKAPAAVHGLARAWLQIGRNPVAGGSRIAPHIGSVVSLEKSLPENKQGLPAFFALNTPFGQGQGFLEPRHGPFYVSPNGQALANTSHLDGPARFDRRYGLLQNIDTELRYYGDRGAAPAEMFAFNLAARKLTYNADIEKIFIFDQNERARYGTSQFGNACIATRNLLRAKAGVRFIQITQGSWDHHEGIYRAPQGHFQVAKQFDSGLGALIGDLRNEGLLDETLIVAMGEFGRTPGPLNPDQGRDHYLQQAVLVAGAGVAGGRIIGSTDRDGKATADPGWGRNRDIRAEDVEATIYSAMGIDWTSVRKDDAVSRAFEYVPFSDRDMYGPVHELWP